MQVENALCEGAHSRNAPRKDTVYKKPNDYFTEESGEDLEVLSYTKILQGNAVKDLCKFVVEKDCPLFIIESAVNYNIVSICSFRTLPLNCGFENVSFLEIRLVEGEPEYYIEHLPPHVLTLNLENVVYCGAQLCNATNITVARASEFNLDLFPKVVILELAEINNCYGTDGSSSGARGFFKTKKNNSLRSLYVNYVPYIDLCGLIRLRYCQCGEYEDSSDNFSCTIAGQPESSEFELYIYGDVKKYYLVAEFTRA